MPKQLWETASTVSAIQQNLKGINVGLTLLMGDRESEAPLTAEATSDFVLLLKQSIEASINDLDQVRAEIMACYGQEVGHD